MICRDLAHLANHQRPASEEYGGGGSGGSSPPLIACPPGADLRQIIIINIICPWGDDRAPKFFVEALLETDKKLPSPTNILQQQQQQQLQIQNRQNLSSYFYLIEQFLRMSANKRHAFSAEQTHFLESQFQAQRYISIEQRATISKQLALSQQQALAPLFKKF
uniref:Homeobox domain-containing protein n=1 Tax=Globodera rostochiensis TaxID=31243 RepID=A0A914HLM2_GLORO